MSIKYIDFLEEFKRLNDSEIFMSSSSTIEELFKDWLKKCNYPGAVDLDEQDIILIMDTERAKCLEERELAMSIIKKMDAKEFQTKVLNDTLPNFPRAIVGDKDYISGIIRDTCHAHIVLTEENLKNNIINYAEAHRYKIRFMETKDFKELCYY
jgi:hypothetical protein